MGFAFCLVSSFFKAKKVKSAFSFSRASVAIPFSLSVEEKERVSLLVALSLLCSLISPLLSEGTKSFRTEAQRLRGKQRRNKEGFFSLLFFDLEVVDESPLLFPRYAGRAAGCPRRREALGCHRCCDVSGRSRRRQRKSSRFGASNNNKLSRCCCCWRQQWQRQQRSSSSILVVFSRRGKGRRCLDGKKLRLMTKERDLAVPRACGLGMMEFEERVPPRFFFLQHHRNDSVAFFLFDDLF